MARTMLGRRSCGPRVLAVILAIVGSAHVYQMASAGTAAAAETNSAFAAPRCVPHGGLEGPTIGLRNAELRDNSLVSQKSWGCSAQSEVIRTPLHIGLRIQQVYDHWIGPVNLDRQGLRISGFETYAVVATVMLQVVVGFYGGVAQPDEDSTPTQRFVYDLQMALLMIGTLCSTFTMVTFLLNKICDVTALGLYKDVAYATFHEVTKGQRMAGFWSLIVTMTTFLLAFALDLLRRIQGKRGLAAKVIAVGGGMMMMYQWFRMMFLANKYIFHGPRFV